MIKQLTINLAPTYPIYIGDELLTHDVIKNLFTNLNKKLVIITDSNLVATIGKTLQKQLEQYGLTAELLAFPAGEAHKTRETKQSLEDQLLQRKYGRDTCLIALGGGVVTDLVGFLAATYCRGVPAIYVPTTLLAMVDASIGGKTGVDTPYGKNLIGCFYQPKAVLMNVNYLLSLSANEYRNGMVEIIKHAMIADADLFHRIKHQYVHIMERAPNCLIELIDESCLIKKSMVEKDEKDLGMRQLLNFGHTIGHAIEAVSHYQLSHGEAVAIGMLVECYLSMQYGLLDEAVLQEIRTLLEQYHLPLQTNAFADKELFLEKMALDKKSINNKAYFVLLEKIGKPYVNAGQFTTRIDAQLLDQALDWANSQFNRT
jgi:3-dehydroquinate synthase